MTGHYVVVESLGNAVLKPFEVPRPKAGEVLLENDYTVVSAGTERANLMNLPNTSGGFPYHPGYCGIGRVIAVGDGVENVGKTVRESVRYDEDTNQVSVPSPAPTREQLGRAVQALADVLSGDAAERE